MVSVGYGVDLVGVLRSRHWLSDVKSLVSLLRWKGTRNYLSSAVRRIPPDLKEGLGTAKSRSGGCGGIAEVLME
jgi:hypothetical protein